MASTKSTCLLQSHNGDFYFNHLRVVRSHFNLGFLHAMRLNARRLHLLWHFVRALLLLLLEKEIE